MNEDNRFSHLSSFVEYARDHLDWDFDREEFEDRFLFQKYIFFAQRMGFPTDYSYGIYVFGAYSPDLAQDYYSEELEEHRGTVDVENSFDSQAFHEFIRNRDDRWLEIASTLVMYYERYPHLDTETRKERAVQKTMDEKDATEKTVSKILRTVSEFSLLD